MIAQNAEKARFKMGAPQRCLAELTSARLQVDFILVSSACVLRDCEEEPGGTDGKSVKTIVTKHRIASSKRRSARGNDGDPGLLALEQCICVGVDRCS